MRTNIVLNEALLEEAFRYANVTTKRELIDLALREFIKHRKRHDLRLLKGNVHLSPDYDYKSLHQSRE